MKIADSVNFIRTRQRRNRRTDLDTLSASTYLTLLYSIFAESH